MSAHSYRIGFGGGCHWCTEAVFSSLDGLEFVKQGFIKSGPPNDQFSEAVLIQFNEDQISLSTLIEVHLRTHASTSSHSMREKYRSAIYVDDEGIADQCKNVLLTIQEKFEKPLVTQVLDLIKFKPSSESYANYYATNPNRPFCVTHIEPKLSMLKRDFSTFLKH